MSRNKKPPAQSAMTRAKRAERIAEAVAAAAIALEDDRRAAREALEAKRRAARNAPRRAARAKAAAAQAAAEAGAAIEAELAAVHAARVVTVAEVDQPVDQPADIGYEATEEVGEDGVGGEKSARIRRDVGVDGALLLELQKALNDGSPPERRAMLARLREAVASTQAGREADADGPHLHVSGLFSTGDELVRLSTGEGVVDALGPSLDLKSPMRFLRALEDYRTSDAYVAARCAQGAHGAQWVPCPCGAYTAFIHVSELDELPTLLEHAPGAHLHVLPGPGSGITFRMRYKRPDVPHGAWLGPESLGRVLGCVVIAKQGLTSDARRCLPRWGCVERKMPHGCAYGLGEGGALLLHVFEEEDRWSFARALPAGVYAADSTPALSVRILTCADKLGCMVAHGEWRGSEVVVFTLLGWS